MRFKIFASQEIKWLSVIELKELCVNKRNVPRVLKKKNSDYTCKSSQRFAKKTALTPRCQIILRDVNDTNQSV